MRGTQITQHYLAQEHSDIADDPESWFQVSGEYVSVSRQLNSCLIREGARAGPTGEVAR